MDARRQVLVLYKNSGDGSRRPLKIVRHDSQGRCQCRGGGLEEPDSRPVDLQAVIARVDQPGDTDTLPNILKATTTEDGHDEARPCHQLFQRTSDVAGPQGRGGT